MKTWNVYGIISASKYLGQVEAETEEEAIEKGWGLETAFCPTLCHQCSNYVSLEDLYEVRAEED